MNAKMLPAVLTAASAAALLLGGCHYDDKPRSSTDRSGGGVYQASDREGRTPEGLRRQAGSDGRQQGRVFGIPEMGFPSGEDGGSLVQLSAMSDQREVRVGQPFHYRMSVTNVSNELTLDNVVVHQEMPESVNVEGVNPPQAAEGERGHWTIGTLSPGETREFEVAVVAQEPGDFESCLRVTYEPVMCTMISVVAPQLQLRKEMPEMVLVCEPIPVRYTVANTGTGTTAPVTIREQLPEGIVGPRGESTINIPVGPLAAGQEESFEIRLSANRPGELPPGEAMAVSEDGMEVRAEGRPTMIVAPDLDIQIRGPETEFTEREARYVAVVRNTGQGPAMNAAIRLDVQGRARIVGSEILRSGRAGEGQPAGGDAQGGQPRDAQQPRTPQGGQADQTGTARAQRAPSGPGVIPLGDIGPGEEVEVGIIMTSSQPGTVNIAAMATALCADNPVQEVTTNFRGITSLLLELIDTNDPVRIGEEEIYRISVTNQGSIADHNVVIQAQVPEGFEVVNIEGPTPGEMQDGRLVFTPLETLPPGRRATWTVRVVARNAGDFRFAVQLTSESLTTPVTSNEATKAY